MHSAHCMQSTVSLHNSVYNGRASVRTKYTMAKSGLLLNTMPKFWAALNHSTSPVWAYIAQLFSPSKTFDDKHGSHRLQEDVLLTIFTSPMMMTINNVWDGSIGILRDSRSNPG